MTDSNWPRMKRRDFLVSAAGLAGSAVSGIGWAAQPCPPPSLGVSGGSSATTGCVAAAAGELPALVLTCNRSGRYPWTFGHPFRQGDVPAGYSISSDSELTQADVRNRWPDGSVKFAVLSGVATFSAGLPRPIKLAHASNSPSGVAVAEPSASWLDANVSVTLTGAGSGRYTPAAARTQGAISWDGARPHKVRQFVGPVMSEFHYYSPTSDAHLVIWWYIRVYSTGDVEVETAIEQGWMRIASAVEKQYTAAISVGNTQRFADSVAHRHHARWSRRDWVGSDPLITPRHDRAYLVSTRMVPSYAAVTVSETILNGLAQTSSPMNRHNFSQAAAGGGYHQHLGLLPLWDAAYVISGDARAYRGLLANEQASNCCNVGPSPAGFVNRDESTGLPAAHLDYYGESYSNRYAGANGGSIVRGSDTSGRPWTTDPAHSWAAGYLPYLVTGRWFSLETCQFLTVTEFLTWGIGTGTSDATRFRKNEDRAAAWQIRQMACALAITPDSHSLRARYTEHFGTCVSAWHTIEVGHNNLGLRLNIYNNTDYGPSPYNTAGMFQQYFVSAAFGFAHELTDDVLGSTAKTQLLACAQFHALLPVGLLGTRPGGFCFRRAATYGYVVGPARSKPLTSASFFSSFAAMYDACVAAGQIGAGESCALGSDLVGGSIPDATSYWGNFLPAAAYAANIGVTGASAAWGRMTGASNWPTFYADLGRAPQHAIVPRIA